MPCLCIHSVEIEFPRLPKISLGIQLFVDNARPQTANFKWAPVVHWILPTTVQVHQVSSVILKLHERRLLYKKQLVSVALPLDITLLEYPNGNWRALQISHVPKVVVTFRETEDSTFLVFPRTRNRPSIPALPRPNTVYSSLRSPRSLFFDPDYNAHASSQQSIAYPFRPSIDTQSTLASPRARWSHSAETLRTSINEELLKRMSWMDVPRSPTSLKSPPPPRLPPHPILRLPPEPLRAVFRACLSDTDLIEPDVNAAPLVFGQICRAWRIIALSTPSLWSSLFICGSDVQIGKLLPLIPIWLSRSDTLPLSIGVCVLQVGGHTFPALERAIGALCTHSKRWERLHLRIPAAYLDRLLNRPTLPLPALRSLRLDSAASHHDSNVWAFRIGASAPALRELTVNGAATHLSTCRVVAPWAQLASFSCAARMGIDDCFEVFRLGAVLESCALLAVQTAFRGPPLLLPRTPIAVPHLASLSVTCVGDSFDGLAALFNSLHLPTLCSLEIAVAQPVKNWPQSQFRGLIARCGPPLKRLRFVGVPMYEDHLLEAIRLLPELKDLEVLMDGFDVRTQKIKDYVAITRESYIL